MVSSLMPAPLPPGPVGSGWPPPWRCPWSSRAGRTGRRSSSPWRPAAVGWSLHRFVRPGASLTIGRNRRDFVMLNKDDISVGGYDLTPRQEAGMDESIDYKNSFVDAHKTLTEEQVYKEACRCLGCGVSVVDPNKCIGCGVCTTRCKFDAIHLVRDHPECSTMVKSEDKFKAILPYAAKRAMKICFGKKTPEEKESIRKHKEYKKAKKASKKETQNA